MNTMSQLFESAQYDEAWRQLLTSARTETDYTKFQKLCRWHSRLKEKSVQPGSSKTLKVALLGGATTDMIEGPLALSIETLGLTCDLISSEYNTFVGEMLDPDSNTAGFRPNIAVLVTTASNLPSWPKAGDDVNRVNGLVNEVCDHWLTLCRRLHENSGSEIIINNFHSLASRPLGNLSAKTPWDLTQFLKRLNLALGERAPAYVHINDVEYLSTYYGLNRWFDTRYWYHAKQPVSFDCIIPYVRNTARIIGALYGKSAKCIALDLDNTIWGGVVGDDGVDGIAIGEGSALGEAYKAFQEYLLQLKQRGILLAVCSKNDESNAKAPFNQIPEMVLKREDIVSFKANWGPKPDNLRAIAEELNIGLDAIVFVDDNPAEREHVRQRLPEVRVVEMPDDPADYVAALDQSGLFEVTSISSEDQLRTQQYQANENRVKLRESVEDYRKYLESLQQRAEIGPFQEKDLERITQLINKSNQYNLTTLRMNRSEVENLMKCEDVLTISVRLKDRFGDNGLISVFIGRSNGESLHIDEWLMSCRVLKRGVENLVCNYAADTAKKRGARTLNGVYIPTQKNSLVQDHYRSLGYELVSEDTNGTTHWRLDLDQYEPFDIPIEIMET